MASQVVLPTKEELAHKRELSLAEAAIYLGVGKQTIYNWKTLGKSPRRTRDHRGRLVFLRADLDAWKRDNSKVTDAYKTK